jgi:steroid 5-alpha reductase family enzyme
MAMAPASVWGIVEGSLLSSGPSGILGLAAIASAIVTPLTLYRQAYSFSVGYGLSVAAMGLALQTAFATSSLAPPVASLVSAMVFYGIRLAFHLLLREFTVPSKQEQLKSMDKTPRPKRVPFSLTIGLFYSFLMTPALYLCRASARGSLSPTATTIATAGSALAWFGAIVEAWTDAHKFWAKRGKDDATDFHGPSTWWYGVSRHPNYLGEITVWIALLTSGLPALMSSFSSFGAGSAAVALVCSLLGTTGIVNTMLMATKRLEGRQEDKYGGQEAFDSWVSKTGKLVPTKPLQSALPVVISAALAALVA